MIDTVEIFPWNENLKTGIDIVDEQHQKLVQLINLLAQHIANKSDALTLEKVFKQLTDYAHYHFETEEKVWHKYLDGDAWVEGHEKTHASFLTQVLEIKEHSDNGTLSEVVEDILSFLTHWLAFHILDSDKRMAKAVLAVQAGQTIEQAKISSAEQMNGAMRVLIETVLSMYDSLSVRTLALMKEIAERERAQARLKLTSKVIEGSLEAI
ncbi:MAG: bacteriohemerythrin, partial [Methylophaga sp.]|nr:bacteriohemerythrin [Methylophaga sp.]